MAEDAILSPNVVDSCWTTINFKPDTSPTPSGSKFGLATLQHYSDSETKQGIKSSGSLKRKRDDTKLQTFSHGLGDAVHSSSTERQRPATTERAKHKSTIVRRFYPSTMINPVHHGTEMKTKIQKSSPDSYLDASDATSIKGRQKFGIPEDSLAILEDDQAQLNDYIVNHTIALIATVATKPFLSIDSMTEDFQVKPSLETSEYVFVPLHLTLKEDNGHWALAIVNETRLSVQVYDSMPSLDLQGQIEQKLRKIYKKHSWPIYEQLIFSSPIIQQNGHDCGIMVLIAALYRAAGFEVPDRAEHAPWRAILFELLRSRRSYSIKIPESYNELVKLLKKLSSSTHSFLTGNQGVKPHYETSQQPKIPALRVFQVLRQAFDTQEIEAVIRISRVIDFLEGVGRRGRRNDIMLTEALIGKIAEAEES
ncbi:hypothetical protein B0I35DRAFT_440970 [Stachybotrys elegans]|uniref:Ubiquitin-like protease family profile domain-containing protein n=1 Tax=Stachybotrys elegans TaxID=80388 RepID=A0A8K0SI94_9HYPO|nr:hypothetical protein B0I35DRAFT_440970 [Stachybotrys elegans]